MKSKATNSESVPPEFASALAKNPRAQATFAKLPPSHRREHLKYINEAKQAETRARRAEKAVAFMLEREAARQNHTRLTRECAKLVPQAEQQMAEEG
jgi:uncharacterized protein YdeI (YjbR/CyaY-like superfamily)